MARRFFRKLTPRPSQVHENRVLRLFGSLLLNHRLWHLNRHSTATGVASGLFWAWIPAPVQTVGAVGCAIAGKGNVPLAMAFTWLSNPLTWGLCFYLDYRLGVWLLDREPIYGLTERLEAFMNQGLIEGTRGLAGFAWENLPHLWPMYIGAVLIGGLNAALGYAGVRLLWRWNIVRRWRKRHQAHSRRLGIPVAARRMGLGFAALARRVHLPHRERHVQQHSS